MAWQQFGGASAVSNSVVVCFVERSVLMKGDGLR